jgi:transcriptional regulator with XRE-family HTH domain
MTDRSEILREVMKIDGITQTELARISGMRQPSISAYLSGRRPMSDDLLDRLLNCMGFQLQVDRNPVRKDLDRSPRLYWLLGRWYARNLTPEIFLEWRPIFLRNLEHLRTRTHGQPHERNMDRWQRLLEEGDLPGLRKILTGLDTNSIEMREVTPVYGIISQEERLAVLGYSPELQAEILAKQTELAASHRECAETAPGTVSGPEPAPVEPLSYAERRPYVVADSLDDLRGPSSGKISLPRHLDWSGSPHYDLDKPGVLASVYQTVLSEAASVADLNSWIDRDALVAMWPNLWLPPKIRRIWKERFPELPVFDPNP